MKSVMQMFVRAAILSIFCLGSFSCSEEPITGTEISPLVLEKDSSGLSSYVISDYQCSNSDIPSTPSVYLDHQSVGNGRQSKTLKTTVFNTDTHVFVEAHYIQNGSNAFPSIIDIAIGGTEFQFVDVSPGEVVKAQLMIPNEWFNSYVDVRITQTGFLRPAEVLVSKFIASPCPISLGAELKGGLIGYIFQPGDQGFIEGEIHGLVVSSEDIGEQWLTWPEAIAAADTLDLNGYDDWRLPTDHEIKNFLLNLPALDYDPLYTYGYWTSVEVDEATAIRAEIKSGLVSEPLTVETSPFQKRFGLQVRVVRTF